MANPKYVRSWEIKGKEKLVYIYTYDLEGTVVGVTKWPYALIEQIYNAIHNPFDPESNIRDKICENLASYATQNLLADITRPLIEVYKDYQKKTDDELIACLKKIAQHELMEVRK